MSEKNKSQFEALDARRLPVRIALVAFILFAVAFAWFAVRWQLGNMMAELTLPTEPKAKDVAELAHSFAPSDPLTNWLLASIEKDIFSNGDIESSLEGFIETVRLSPYDYRWWIELGRAYEQAENYEKAEQAYRKAIEIAPAYTYPRWQIGNFYLRRNRADEAFAELKSAAQKNEVYRQQVFSIVWDFYGQDAARLEQIVGDLPEVKTGLVRFYAIKNRAEDSLRVWNSLSEEEKRQSEEIAKVVAQALYEKKYHRAAVEFVRDLGIEPDAKAKTVQNGGFEKPIRYGEYIYFGWKIAQVEKMEINLDAGHKKEGSRSLRVSFNGFSDPQLSNIYQTVTIEPGASYVLSFWLKTENLKSGGTPVLDIVDTRDDKIIETSKPFPTGTNDWQQIRIEFTAPVGAESIYLRTARVYCGDNCPIVGAFWYDDFKLEKK